MTSRAAAFGALLPAVLLMTSCHRPSAATDYDVVIEWKMAPAVPLVDRESVGEFTLLDRSRRPLPGATLQVEGRMQHPGMAPLIEPAREHGPGVYVTRLTFTMAGAWDLSVTGSLRDGQRLRRRVGGLLVGSQE
ncbi:MAG: FixH family protein [Acidobacteria bacterium]|nr:FixH family protein [Acidobacteriota bacterium]